MRVLQINKYINIKGGAEAVVDKISDILIDNNNSVINIGFETGLRLEKIRNATSLGVENSSLIRMYKDRKLVDKIISMIIDNQIEIVIYHNVYHHFPIYELFKRVKKETNSKSILFLHDYKVVCPIQTLYNYEKNEICEKCSGRNFYNSIINKCKDGSYIRSSLIAIDSYYNNKLTDSYSFVDIILTPSSFTKEKVKELGFTKAVKVLPNPIDSNSKGLGLKSKENFNITYIGRLSQEKGVMYLIEVAKKLKHIKFNIVGTGDLNSLVENASREHGNITYLGYKSSTELRSIYESSTYIIAPSLMFEVFGLTILEAMSYGVPVISSGYGGMKELIGDDRGFIIDVDNIDTTIKQIEYIVNIELDMYKKMQSKCFNFYELHSDITFYNRLKKIINNV